jgi:hypothetical protein
MEGKKNTYNEAVQRLQCRCSLMCVAEQTPGEDNSKGMLVDESAEREPKEASEEPNRIEKILDELANGIPELTLVRLSEEDVVLDMDEVMVDVIDEEGSEFSDSDENSEESGK